MRRPSRALAEALSLAEDVRDTPREPGLLARAARLAYVDLADTTHGLMLLEQLASRYPATRVGAWSADQARQLRQTFSQADPQGR